MVSLKDFTNYQFLSGISYSPYKENAAFIVHKPNVKSNSYESSVWLYNESGSHRRITEGGQESAFVWLDENSVMVKGKPGAEIAERIAKGEEWTSFHRVNVHTGEDEHIMDIPLKVASFDMLSENYFVLSAVHDINRPDLYTLTGEEKEKELNLREEEKGYLVLEEIPFCQNGVGYVSGRRNGLYLYNLLNNSLTMISNKYSDVEHFKVRNGKLLYNAIEYKDIRLQSTGLYIFDYKTGDTETLIPQGGYVIEFSDFLNDTDCVFTGWKTEAYEYTNNASIYEVTAKGVRLVCYPDISLGNSLSSDVRYGRTSEQRVFGGELYCVTTEVTRSVIRRFSMDGSWELLHTTDGSVDDFDVCEKGIIFAGQRELTLQELYTLKDGRETRVSAFNEGILPDKLGKLHEMEFENGGFNVHYLVLEPTDMEQGKKYPAVFYIHGGAKVIFGPVFHHEMQTLSGNGYYVIYGDPRGSDGKGTEFATLKGHYGEQDYSDMMKAVDTAIERFPQIDNDNIACVGGSYGGLMTNMIITRTHRFKCAIAQRSISNLISNFSATDNGINFVTCQMEATPWVNYDGLWNVSPLKNADKVKTPLLLIHSELDFRCHYIEAVQMFNALKFHGVESRMILIEGENHDLSRSGRPKQRIRRLSEIVSWLDKHMKS